MSDSTRDPIQALENFGTGGITVNPLDPAAVRRLGDQRRRRQNTVYGAIAAVAVAVAVIPTAILATHNDGGSKPLPITHTPTPTPTVITYPEPGVEVKTAADVSKLTGTTEDFKSFIATTLQKALDDSSGCPDADHGVYVTKYSSDGFALGGVNSCGGYAALWSIQNGEWKEAIGTQDTWRCGDLTRFSVPDGFAGECYGSPVLFGPGPVSGFSIGMTTEQVQAAGGVINGDPASDCAAVRKAGVTDAKDAPVSEIEMTRGKVIALFASKDVLTSRGIEVGSTEEEVMKAYPDGHYDIHHYWHVAIDAGSEYEIGIDGNKTVSELLIQTTGSQGCYG